MKLLFIFCEGRQDVSFLDRLFHIKNYKRYNEDLVGYPEYLKRFFENYFKMMAFKTISSEEEDAEDNKEKELILSFPLQTYKSPDKKNVVIPLVFEGDSEPKEGSKNKRRLILERIKVLARTEVKWNEKSNIDKISCLFISIPMPK